MKINSIKFANVCKLNSTQGYCNRPSSLNNTNKDVFIKSTDTVSFTGNNPKENKVKDNLVDAMIVTGVVGAPFLASVAAGVAMAKGQNPEEIFLSDGSYFCNTKDLSINSDKVTADANDGVFKVEGTGINIDAVNKKYDYVDTTRGVYKNFDGSVDIDLQNNKYIDKENGIFIDQKEDFSVIYDGDHFEYIALPQVPAFTSGYPTNGLSGWQMPVQHDYNLEPDITPEPDTFDKITHFVKSLFSLDDYPKDMFGRRLFPALDNKGNNYLTAIPEGNPTFEHFLNHGLGYQEASNMANESMFKLFLQEHKISLDPDSVPSGFEQFAPAQNSGSISGVAANPGPEVSTDDTEITDGAIDHGETVDHNPDVDGDWEIDLESIPFLF